MAPKAKKDDKKAAPAEATHTGFNETEAAMYELQIADLNRKLARLRTAIQTYEIKNEELQTAYEKLDEDRADIIAFLKKQLNTKTEENIELKDRVVALEELRAEESARSKEKIEELEKNFTVMKAQLTSENKLLAGKLNTLEEFRAIKEDLLKKFECQEKQFEDQEMKYKRIIYDAEKKFVVGKDKLKKEMEARLLHLAQEFQDASECRIAASTHRVIRENIALNNQLDNLLYTQAKVAEQNERYKEDERDARNAMEVAEEERDKAINKSIVQLKVIDRLTAAFQNMQKDKALYDRKVLDFEHLECEVQKLTKENENMALQIRILEQNLHSSMGQQNKHVVETSHILKERDKYKEIIKDTISTIHATLKVDQWALMDPKREIIERKVILQNFLDVLARHRQAVEAESGVSLMSFSNVYEKGDLGFVPKPKAPTKTSKTSIVASSTQMLVEEKEGSSIGSTKSSTHKSLKTMPSLSIMSPLEDIVISSKESVPSFTVTSLHSSPSSSAESEDSMEGLTDVEKQLALSKLEIQKSILKDLQVSQTTFHSKSRIDEGEAGKSKTSVADLKSGENIIPELPEGTETPEDGGEKVEEKDEGKEDEPPTEAVQAEDKGEEPAEGEKAETAEPTDENKEETG